MTVLSLQWKSLYLENGLYTETGLRVPTQHHTHTVPIMPLLLSCPVIIHLIIGLILLF